MLSGPPGVEWMNLVAMFYMYRISFSPVFWFCFIPLSGLWENTVAAKISRKTLVSLFLASHTGDRVIERSWGLMEA